MTHNLLIQPTPISPKKIPDLSQGFDFEHDNASYKNKRPSNINTSLGSGLGPSLTHGSGSGSGSSSSNNYIFKRPIGCLTPIQENETKLTKDKIMRRDRSLGFEEAKSYIRSLSFGPHSQ